MILERKATPTQYDILDVIKDRWSPRAFEDRPVPPELLLRLFEAMRWAPSSMNEQPWRVIYAHKGEAAHDLLAAALMPGNKPWAEKAPVLLATLVKKTFTRNGASNRTAWHDLGQAIGNLSIQATSLGLGLHQMGGIRPDQIAKDFAVPDDYEVVTAIALGFFGDPDQLAEDLKARELSERKRKPVSEFAFHGTFHN